MLVNVKNFKGVGRVINSKLIKNKLIKSRLIKNEAGFSMLELLVYVGIVGVIAAFAVPRYVNTMAMANTAKIQSDLQTLDAAITMYQLQNGANPTNIAADLDDYVAHLDRLSPPAGKCILKDGGVVDITAEEYALADGGEEAQLQGHTVDEFGRGDGSVSGGAAG